MPADEGEGPLTPPTETVLITGASSGLGAEFARLFAADGSRLVLVARRRDRLDALADELRAAHGVEVHVVAEDLGDPAAPGRIEAWVAAQGMTVDVLVNNAGFGGGGRFHEAPLERQLEMIQVNVAALAELARRFLPGMVARRGGGILNVASTSAFQPGPMMATYYATKAFVLSLSEAMAAEVAGSGVTISCLAPGSTATEFRQAAGTDSADLVRPSVARASDVARAGYAGFRRGQVLVVPGFMNWIGTMVVRILPRRVVVRMMGRLNGMPRP